MESSRRTRQHPPDPQPAWPPSGSPGVATARGPDSPPVLADILRRARLHKGWSLREVEKRTGVPNAHLSQIEHGRIRKPDAAILWRLADWAGYFPTETPEVDETIKLALQILAELEPEAQAEALRYLQHLRNARAHGRPPPRP
jgi:transcriptional regulator with XRE-family HTH domain